MAPEGPTLRRMAAVSLSLHLILLVVLGGSSLFRNRRFITPNPYFVDLVSAPAPPKPPAVKRKPPSKKKEEPAPAPPKETKKPEKTAKTEPVPKPPPEPGLKPVRKPVPSASAEIERLRAIDRLRRLQALRSVVDARREESGAEEPPQATADADSGDRAHVYYGVVTHRVWQHWTYAGDPQPGWETLVYIQLDDRGALLDQNIEESSGDEEFDRSVLRALAKAAPFPPPPEGIDRNIVFRFRP